MKVKYREGDWFAVPLEGGGFATGVVARANPKGALLGYFFGPERGEIPSVGDIADLKPADAVLVGHFGHLGLRDGRWPIIGRTDRWDRSEWSASVFVRYEELTGRTFQVFYDDDDPARWLRDELVQQGADVRGPKDGMMGAGFVELRMTRLVRQPSTSGNRAPS